MLISCETPPVLLLQRFRVENFLILTVIHLFCDIFGEQ